MELRGVRESPPCWGILGGLLGGGELVGKEGKLFHKAWMWGTVWGSMGLVYGAEL